MSLVIGLCVHHKIKQVTVTSIKASLTLASPPAMIIYNFLLCVPIVLYFYHHIECDHLCISHSQLSARQKMSNV